MAGQRVSLSEREARPMYPPIRDDEHFNMTESSYTPLLLLFIKSLIYPLLSCTPLHPLENVHRPRRIRKGRGRRKKRRGCA